MDQSEIIKKLRIAGAAYQAANEMDYCGNCEECVDVFESIITSFTEAEFYEAGNKYNGWSPYRIIMEIIELTGKLNVPE